MKTLIYAEVGDLATIDDLLGRGVDAGTVETYAVVTVDGAPVLYAPDVAPNYDRLNEMGTACMGVTE